MKEIILSLHNVMCNSVNFMLCVRLVVSVLDSHPCLPPQGESFREVMRRIQTMLDIQEKEFEKV